MPILSGSVTFSRFLAESPPKAPSDTRRWFLKGLKSQAFEPLNRRGDDDRAAGFVELEDPRSTEFGSSNVFSGERALFAWRVDTLKVPAADLKEELANWLRNFERDNDRRPTRTEKNEAKSNLRDVLRTKARIVTKTHDVSWNLRTQQVQLWTSSRKLVEEIVLALQTGFEIKLEPLVPGHFAAQANISEDALSPTPELVGGEALEVTRGAA